MRKVLQYFVRYILGIPIWFFIGFAYIVILIGEFFDSLYRFGTTGEWEFDWRVWRWL